MAEKHTLFAEEKVNYEGVLEFNDLITFTDNYFLKLNYDKRVTNKHQNVSDTKKNLKIYNYYWKKVSNYIKFVVKIDLIGDFLNVEEKRNNTPIILQKGKFSVHITATVLTDYKKSWEQKPEYFFLRTLFNNWFFKVKITDWDSVLKNHVSTYKVEIKSFFNTKKLTKK